MSARDIDQLSKPGPVSHPLPTHPDTIAPVSPRTPNGRGSVEGWLIRQRRALARRRADVGRQRVVNRIELLGPQWHIVDYHEEDPDFLAIGPAGIFQVTVCDHGRAKVQLAGDVVQVDRQRPPYVAQARRDAARISHQMSAMIGRRIPVIPVVAFHGSGEIVYYGRPPDGCVVTSYRDVGRALDAHGKRIAPHTVLKLVALANRVDPRSVGQSLGVGMASGGRSYG